MNKYKKIVIIIQKNEIIKYFLKTKIILKKLNKNAEK